jgi:hypothetical protein
MSECGNHYGFIKSKQAIADARASNAAFDGGGPFLLAWSPAEEAGKQDALVLVSNLSDVTTAEQTRESSTGGLLIYKKISNYGKKAETMTS